MLRKCENKKEKRWKWAFLLTTSNISKNDLMARWNYFFKCHVWFDETFIEYNQWMLFRIILLASNTFIRSFYLFISFHSPIPLSLYVSSPRFTRHVQFGKIGAIDKVAQNEILIHTLTRFRFIDKTDMLSVKWNKMKAGRQRSQSTILNKVNPRIWIDLFCLNKLEQKPEIRNVCRY